MEEVGYGRYKREERRERGREKEGSVISSSAQRRNVKSEQSQDRGEERTAVAKASSYFLSASGQLLALKAAFPADLASSAAAGRAGTGGLGPPWVLTIRAIPAGSAPLI
jgi:hypothetical protein